MKLATLRDGTRDGTLLVVSKDLKRALKADHVSPTLQAALDDWSYAAPLLAQMAADLDADQPARAFDFDPAQCMAPLPRAPQLVDGSAYLVHAELIMASRKQKRPDNLQSRPLMYQGCSAPLLGPCEDIAAASEAQGIDLEVELAVVTGDLAMGANREDAGEAIRLVMLMNDVSLRKLVTADLAAGFGFLHSKPPSSFSPVAVTPDELGEAWDGKRLRGPVRASINGELLGEPDAGEDMHFDFPQLIMHAAKTRPLTAGTIVGSGTVSNRDRAKGAGCLFERRAEEILADGKAKTPFLKFGDRVRIEMKNGAGRSVFGAIDQQVVEAR
ncbi:MAG: fumarylacetoacetate hydrolase family protein [Betaproteobacteria bacterium]|nr:fumarylacetoacetate hydrolase family protein [Betaproteobacteria bacterium]